MANPDAEVSSHVLTRLGTCQLSAVSNVALKKNGPVFAKPTPGFYRLATLWNCLRGNTN